MAFSKARRQGFSRGTPLSSPPSSVNGLSQLNKTKVNAISTLSNLKAELSLRADHLAGLVVRRPPRERKVQGLNPACAGIFSGSSHTSDLKIGTPVATLPGAWRYRVSTGTGRPGVSTL